MNTMHFSTEIHAPKEKVWSTLWNDETFRVWADIIDKGTYMVGELQEGAEVQYISAENGYGVTSLVEKLVPAEFLLLRHNADTQDKGARDREEQWTGSTETYTLTEQNGATNLMVAMEVPEELEEYFQEVYPKALECIKELAQGIKKTA